MDEQTFAALILAIASGEPTRRALAAAKVSPGAFYSLVGSDAKAAEQYACARGSSMDALADEALAIADDMEIPSDHKRVMVDSRKWFLSKLAPKKYGERLELAGDADSPLHLHITPNESKY